MILELIDITSGSYSSRSICASLDDGEKENIP